MAIPRIGGAGANLPNSGLVNNATAVGKPPFITGYYSGFTNTITLTPGATFNIPAGTWWVTTGPYTFLQWLDPVTVTGTTGTTGASGLWRTKPTSATRADFVNSDGTNFRLCNSTGCAIGAVITSGGAGYPNAGIFPPGSTAAGAVTVSASSGGSTWTAIVGGAVSLTLATATGTTTAGAGYNFPPICVVDAPPPGGLQATAYCSGLSTGTVPVANIVITNQGAGYTQVPNVTLLPDPREALATTPGPTTQAAVVVTLTATGQITGLYPISHGTVLTGVPTIAFAGASAATSAATATAMMNFTVTGVGITSAGSSLGAGTTLISTSNTMASTVNFLTNPLHNGVNVTFPRPARVVANIVGGLITTTGAVIEDAGLGIQQVPSTIVIPVVTSTTSIGPVTLVAPPVGGTNDTSLIQPA